VKIVFWLSLIGILYTYLGYPAAMWMLARLRPRPWKAAPITPSVSVVLAVHNGIALLPRKIQHLLDLDYPNIEEIVIVSDGSTDGTAELLARQQHPLLKTIVLKEHGGKAVAVNAGVAQAKGEVILFLDLRQGIAPGAIQQLVTNFADATVGCVCGRLTLLPTGQDAASGAVGGVYWRYEQWLRGCEATIDSPVGVCGCFYAIRRELAARQPAGIILDDMFQPLSIIRQGYRCVLDPHACVYDTWPENVEGEFHRKVRTLAGNFQLFQLAPWTLSPRNRVLFQLVSHKVARLAVPYLLVLLLASSLALSAGSRFYAACAALQVFGWALSIAGLGSRISWLDRIAAPASALLVLNAAAVAGLYKFLATRGPLWKIWNSSEPEARGSASESENLPPLEPDAAAVDIGERRCNDSHEPEGGRNAMNPKRNLLFIAVLGAVAAVGGFVYHHHIVQVKAAKLEHIAAPAPYFPPGAPWTQDVSHAPLDPHSGAIIDWLAGAGGWGNNNRFQIDFSLRVLQADAKTPFVPFHKGPGFYAADSDDVSTFPLPPGGGVEGHRDYDCSDHGDCHLIVVDRSHGKLYEAISANAAEDGVTAGFVAVWNLNRVYPPSGRGDQCTSSDSAGFPVAPLLFNADEIAVGHIDHALRFALPNPRIRAHVYVHPATHAGAPRGPADAPPIGARFRLKASYDVSQLMPEAQVVARALQKYGMFLADGGNIALTAQSDQDTKAKYADLDFDSHSMFGLKVTDFEVVEMGTPIHLTDDCVLNK
jgi:cellulose synthase/poly-beta-1,6-N-acetylglucosamine synthase-like glycosyltransferase